MVLRPRYFSAVPLIGGLSTPIVPAAGADNTVNAGITQFASDRRPFLDTVGPSLRMILDFADLSQSRFMVALGVSGNPLSSVYSNLLRPWRAAKWIGFTSSKAVHTLMLVPRPQAIPPAPSGPPVKALSRPVLQSTSLRLPASQ